MNKNEIERLLRLQSSAYGLLLWIDKRAEQEQELLRDENLEKWRFAESSEEWIRSMHGMIPQTLRPEVEDIAAFARLFSSFFLTSFHVVEKTAMWPYHSWGSAHQVAANGGRKLQAGSPAGKKSPKAKEKVRDAARELRLHALEELALEFELFPTRAQIEKLEGRNSLRDALTLWTYVVELNRRAHFASQGEPVRSLWLAMDKHERLHMTADSVMQVRDLLVSALKSLLLAG